MFNNSRYDRYVFLQRIHKHILQIRIRSPVSDLFRFELVGKDVTVKEDSYDYDWITIYKFKFTTGTEDVLPFPECPVIGWGPGRPTMECGMAPMSHYDGEILTKDTGELEVKFSSISGKDTSNLKVRGVLVQQGTTEEKDFSDHVLQRVENGDVIFNINTPRAGEYALKLYSKDNSEAEGTNFCNYVLTSRQKSENSPFPRGFQEHIGERAALNKMGIKALSHTSGLLKTDEEEMTFEFQNDNNVELSINLSGASVRTEVAKRLITEEKEGNINRFKVRYPQNGNFGVRLMGNTGSGNEPLYDYVVKYRKSKSKRYTPREPPVEKQKVEDDLPATDLSPGKLV